MHDNTKPNASTLTPPANGRDQSGRFGKGNPGGPGRPPRATEVSYLLALAGVVTVDRWRGILELIAGQADKGDLKAAQWLGKLLIGNEPGRLSEVLAGVVHGGPHYRVVEAIERKEEQEDDYDLDCLIDDDKEDRRERIQNMIDGIGNPDEQS